jgi:putative addiction module component (TIGR02574 family)
MSQAATELLDAALALPGEHRLELAEALLASLDPALRPPLDESWREIIRRRSAELRAGTVSGIPWSDVKARARDGARG